MAIALATGIAPEKSRLYHSAAWALLAEVILLAGVVALLSRRPPTPSERPPTLLTLTATPEIKAVVTPPAPQLKEIRKPVAQPLPHIRQAVHAAAAMPQPPTVPSVQSIPLAAPTEPAPPQHPAPAAAAPIATDPTPSFEGALRAAIQAALRYPESARMAGMKGRARVAFTYRDGVVSNTSIAISSGIGLLDRAALAAVQDAACPKPEPAFVGKTLTEQVWVDFKLDNAE